MFGLSSLQTMLASCALSALVGAVGVGIIVHKVDEGKYAKLLVKVADANLKAISKAVEDQRAADAISWGAEVKAIRDREAENVKTVTLIRKVPYYVPVEVDKRYPLPIGFCVLLDAAASSTDTLGEIDPATVANDVPCEVTASEAVTIIVRNYGEYQKLALQHVSLQDWVLAQTAK